MVSESEVLDGNQGLSEKVEVDRQAVEARYGLRPEELDAEGRYVGELHGDGRQVQGIELQATKVRR